MLANLKGYRTILFNCTMAALAILSAVFPDAQLPDGETVNNVLANAEALILGVALVGNLILRAVTTTPVFRKQEDL